MLLSRQLHHCMAAVPCPVPPLVSWSSWPTRRRSDRFAGCSRWPATSASSTLSSLEVEYHLHARQDSLPCPSPSARATTPPTVYPSRVRPRIRPCRWSLLAYRTHPCFPRTCRATRPTWALQVSGIKKIPDGEDWSIPWAAAPPTPLVVWDQYRMDRYSLFKSPEEPPLQSI